MVGGSVWELKIDSKRLREEIKNDIEKRRREKKKRASRATKRAPKSFAAVWPDNRGSAAKRKGEQFGRPRPLAAHLFARLGKY